MKQHKHTLFTKCLRTFLFIKYSHIQNKTYSDVFSFSSSHQLLDWCFVASCYSCRLLLQKNKKVFLKKKNPFSFFFLYCIRNTRALCGNDSSFKAKNQPFCTDSQIHTNAHTLETEKKKHKTVDNNQADGFSCRCCHAVI